MLSTQTSAGVAQRAFREDLLRHGLLISTGQHAATTRPWLFYFPGMIIIIIALTINFIGDGLRDAFDPTQTRVRA